MLLAIHHREGSFSDHWIKYCKGNQIKFEIVNVFEDNIIDVILKKKFTHFMWHINHLSYAELTLFPNLMNSLDNAGIKTFPNHNTRWHFDDKVAQKYLLESLKAPFVPSHVFYSKEEALKNLVNTSYPIVAKLKRGAGATNVNLLRDFEEAKKYVEIMFSIGLNPNSRTLGNLDQKIRIAKKIKNPISLIKKLYRYFIKNTKELKSNSNEKGYFYYQEFMPNNAYDTRVIIVGDKAVAFKRFNRENDFRASGSGKSSFKDIDIDMIKIAFETSKSIGAQSLAYDFVYDENRTPKIIEICFGFGRTISSSSEVHWTSDLNYHKHSINLQDEMLINYIKL